MGETTSWTTLLYLLGAFILVAPAAWMIIRRGRAPLYIALWLGVALLLALAYQWTGGV